MMVRHTSFTYICFDIYLFLQSLSNDKYSQIILVIIPNTTDNYKKLSNETE